MSLTTNALKYTILPKISIDEFHPKAGTEDGVIVVAFYFRDQEPANDLNTFIQRGFIDTLDVDVSPSTDEDGNYLLFVELERNNGFPGVFKQLLRDIRNVTGKVDWAVSVFGTDQVYSLADTGLFSKIITDPNEYKRVRRSEPDYTNVMESIFSGTLVSEMTLVGNQLTINSHGGRLIAVVEDAGEFDVVMGRNFLSESAYNLTNPSHEARILERMAGNVQVMTVGDYLCLYRDGTAALLSKPELVY